MAGGQPVYIKGYQFTARPLSRWRRVTLDFLPYWQASKPKFVLTVTKLEPSAQSQTIKWFVRFATGIDVTWGQEDISSLQIGKPVDFIIGGKFLGFTGDTLIILPTDLVSEPSHYETVYAFHTTQKSWLTLTFVAAFLAGIFAALGYWLLGLLN